MRGLGQAMTEGEEVTLMDWGNAFVQKIVKNDAGDIVSLEGELHLEGDFKKTKLKIHWLSMEGSDLVNLLLVDFDYIITKKKVRPKGISLFPRPWALLAKSSVQREREREREYVFIEIYNGFMFSTREANCTAIRINQETSLADSSEHYRRSSMCAYNPLSHHVCVCVRERERERKKGKKQLAVVVLMYCRLKKTTTLRRLSTPKRESKQVQLEMQTCDLSRKETYCSWSARAFSFVTRHF